MAQVPDNVLNPDLLGGINNPYGPKAGLATPRPGDPDFVGPVDTWSWQEKQDAREEKEREDLKRWGEIYATPDNTLSNIHQANRRVLGGQGVGSLEAAGMPEVWNPISDVALEATGGAMFGRLGKAWQAGRRALGYGDEVAEGAAKTAAPAVANQADTLRQRAAALATRTRDEVPDTLVPAPAGIAGATTAREAEEASRLWNLPGIQRFASKYFGRWFKESDAIGREGVTGTHGIPLQVWHATPRLIEEFSETARDATSVGTSNFLGPAHYTTTSILDAAGNYAQSSGEDIILQMKVAYDRFIKQGLDPRAASEAATKMVTGEGKYRLMPLHMSIQKPLILDPTGRRATTVLGPQQIIQGYLSYFRKNPELWKDATGNTFMDAVLARGAQGADEVFEQLMAMHPGRGGDIINRIARDAGFDGMVASAKAYFPGMTGVADDTYHYLAFANNQLKSAYHKGTKQTGLFSQLDNLYKAIPLIGAGGLGAAAASGDDEKL